MVKLLNWHIRKDLNLREKWWHRLLLIFYILIIIFLFFTLFKEKSLRFFDYPQWEMVNVVDERLDQKLITLNQIKKVGEKIDRIDSSSYSLNTYSGVDLYEGVYCSENIILHIPSILKNNNISSLGLGWGNWLTTEEFNSYIEKNNDRCVLIDSYSNYNNLGNKIYFLRPSISLFGDSAKNLGFYQVDILKTWIFFILNLIILLILVLFWAYIISVAYHKILLYIIFGKNKKHESKS